MFAGIKKFISGIFQDVDGAFSSKRLILLVMVLAFLVIIGYVAHFGIAVGAGKAVVYAIPEQTLNFLAGALDRIVDLVKVLLLAMVGERAPQLAASFKGNPTAKASPEPDKP